LHDWRVRQSVLNKGWRVARAIPFRFHIQIPLFPAVVCFGSENGKAF
jgi:hypothetical protein